jgi:chromosome segregation ATPase
VARTIRERPRYALLLGLALAGLVAVGALAGVLLAGGDDPSDAGPSPTEVRQAQQLRALRLELRETRSELAAARDEAEAAGEQGDRQRARAASLRRRARQLERQNQALRRRLAQAQQEE